MSDTPRTDALEARYGKGHYPAMTGLARALEHENAALRTVLADYAVEVISIVGIVGCKLCKAEEGPRGLQHAASCPLHVQGTESDAR